MASSLDESLDEIKSRFAHATDQPKWIPLSLTLVEYPQGRCVLGASVETDVIER